MPASGQRTDPFRSYNFKVEIGGVTRAGFRECSGLDAISEPIDYREGTDKPFTVKKLPGMVKYSPIILKWGTTDDASVWDWRKKVIEGKTKRESGSIVLMDEAGEEKLRWNFVEAWPSKWTGPSFNASGNEVAIETLEITHEGLMKA